MPESIPWHHYSDLANTVHDWMPMDSQETWQRNLEDPKRHQMLKNDGWLPERRFTYVLNSHGFRSPEFDDRPSILCLGCSYTMGIGLPLEDTWPSILQQRLQRTCWNLGLGGAALDTVFRIADYYVHHLNVVALVCLLPEITRFELFTDGRPLVQNWINDVDMPIFRTWIADDQNAIANRKKNLLAIQQICDTVNVPFLHKSIRPQELFPRPRARDLMHSGYDVQSEWATNFQSMLLASSI